MPPKATENEKDKGNEGISLTEALSSPIPDDEDEALSEAEQLESDAAEERFHELAGDESPDHEKPVSQVKKDKPSADDDDADNDDDKDDDDVDSDKKDKDDKDDKDDDDVDSDDDDDEDDSELSDDDKPVSISAKEYKQFQNAIELVENLQNGHTEIKDHTEKELQKAFGKIGELNKLIKEGSEPADLTAEDFGELNTEYPEFTKGLVGGLSKILRKPVFDKDALMQEIDEKFKGKNEYNPKEVLEMANDLFTERMLDFSYRGWSAKMKSKEFNAYLDTLPSSEVEAFKSSDDPTEIVGMLKKHDAYIDEQKAAKKEKARKDKNKKSVLTDAEEPETDGKKPSAKSKQTQDDEAAAAEKRFQQLQADKL